MPFPSKLADVEWVLLEGGRSAMYAIGLRRPMLVNGCNVAFIQPLSGDCRGQKEMPQPEFGDFPRCAKQAQSLMPAGTWRPSIALYTASPEPSGVGEHMLTLAAHLQNHCHLAFVCHSTPAALALRQRACTLGVASLALPRDASAWRQLSTFLRAFRPDIFHIHSGAPWEGQQAARVARWTAVPVVLRTEHLPYVLTAPTARERYRAGLSRLNGIICVSEAVRSSYIAAGTPAQLLSVVRNGVTPPAPGRPAAQVRHELGVSDADRLVLTVARLTHQKGHEVLLATVPRVLAAVPQVRFVWAGSGPLGRRLGRRIAKAGLGERVQLLGHRSDVPDLLAAADLFVLPSFFEGLPLVLLEALGTGTPVVATHSPGISEVIEDGVSGLLVEPGLPEVLGDAIVRALGSPKLAAGLAANGLTHVQAQFGASRMATETLSVYARHLPLAGRQAAPDATPSKALDA